MAFTKLCSWCRKELPTKQFYVCNSKHNTSGLSSYCKSCCSAVAHNKSQRSSLSDANLMWRYGRNSQWFNDQYDKQCGICAICGMPERRTGKLREKARLSIDHNHNTKRVRGLLCNACNIALGALRVDTFGELNLIKAIEYLRAYK